MVRRVASVSALLLGVLYSAPAQANPLYFDVNACARGNCDAFAQSGGGSIFAELELVNGNDLLITLTNALNAEADNDDPYLTALGFEYGGLLSGLTFDSFTVLSGNVARPLFTVDSTIRSFFIDFGFGFSGAQSEGRFQAMDPNEVVQILIGTTGDVAMAQFNLAVAKLEGMGDGGASGSVVLTGTPQAAVPEPGSLMALMVGLGTLTVRRRWAPKAS